MAAYRLRDWQSRQDLLPGQRTGHRQKSGAGCQPLPDTLPSFTRVSACLTSFFQTPDCCRSSRLRTFRSPRCIRTDFPFRLSCCSEYARSDNRHTRRSLQSKSHLPKFPCSKSFLYKTRNPVLIISSGFNITPAALFWKSCHTKVFIFVLLTDPTYLC